MVNILYNVSCFWAARVILPFLELDELCSPSISKLSTIVLGDSNGNPEKDGIGSKSLGLEGSHTTVNTEFSSDILCDKAAGDLHACSV